METLELSLFVSRTNAICKNMGAALRRSALSPNITDRLDFSCALFTSTGELFGQAAHIPVHLGSMAYAMKGLVKKFAWEPKDVVIVNDPFMGGTHLPDVTVITPIFVAGSLAAFAATRAHHADIGCDSAGSMPLSSSIHQEGLLISPCYLSKGGVAVEETRNLLESRLKNPQNTYADIAAQVSANSRGVAELKKLASRYELSGFKDALRALMQYANKLAKAAIKKIPNGVYEASEALDNDGFSSEPIKITVSVRVSSDEITVNFLETSSSVQGNLNCPISVPAAAVYYVFFSLMSKETPACAGSLKVINISAPQGSLVNAQLPSAVAAGNVETSQRIVDVILLALSQAIPQKIPASSQGTMNNVAMGSASWDYYETIAGGTGAHAAGRGLDGKQSHMTNTLNTSVEIMEKNYPLIIKRYALRTESGGKGLHHGGEGLIREYQILEPTKVTLLTERRILPPTGHFYGGNGSLGINKLNGEIIEGKVALELKKNDVLRIETPGGAGWGAMSP
ncbi:MAG: hydantoinase B/oxoprolinase family protein [Proteobacteria bacterium]|nr:hydantoinase B/oxoprolinase family protein [Pseudomonadota bacterium]